MQLSPTLRHTPGGYVLFCSLPVFRRDNDGAGMVCTLIFHKTDNSVYWRLTGCRVPLAAAQSLCQPDIPISPRAHLSTITGYTNRSLSRSVPLAPRRVKTAGWVFSQYERYLRMASFQIKAPWHPNATMGRLGWQGELPLSCGGSVTMSQSKDPVKVRHFCF